MTPAHRQQTIGRRVLMWILICSSIITFTMTCIQLLFDYRQQSSLVDNQFVQIGQVSIDPISQALWMLDKDLLTIQIEGILKHRDIVYVKIEGTDYQNTLLEVGNNQVQSDQINRTFDLFHGTDSKKNLIGTLHVTATLENVYAYLRERVILIVVIQGIKTFLSSFFILLIMHLLVIRHIKQIVEYISNIKFNDQNCTTPEHQLTLRRESVDDELGQLSSAINDTKSRLLENYHELKKQSSELEVEIERRNQSEKSLRVESSRSSAMLQAVNDGIIAINLNQQVLKLNEGAKKLLNLTNRDTLHQNINDIVAFSITNIENQPKYSLKDFLASKNEQDITGYIRSQDNHYTPVSIRVCPIFEEIGQLHSRVVIIRDESESHELKRVTYNATHDYMTGLKNRMGFDPALNQVIESYTTSKDNQKPYTLAVIDLDKFKFINDTYGHQQGDEILCFVAEQMKLVSDENDHPARLGGDEFAILFNKDIFSAEEQLIKLIQNMKAARFDWQQQNRNLVSASIGLTPIYANDKANLIFTRADMASYSVKYNGGGSLRTTYICHDQHPEQEESAEVHSVSLKDLHDAIKENQLQLHAQPICTIEHQSQSKPSSHLEILIRMKGSGRLIMPNEFMSVADAYKYTPNIDLWVLKKLSYLIDKYALQNWTFHVNLSSHTFIDTAVSKKLLDLLRIMNNSCFKNTICFEFTENIVLSDKHKLTDFIIAAQQYNSIFALDNYGSGYLSHGYLKDIPLNMIKIDGEIIRKIESDPEDTIAIKSIINMCKQHRILTVAECVQSRQVIDILKNIGIHYVQGYEISKIHPIETFIDIPTKKQEIPA